MKKVSSSAEFEVVVQSSSMNPPTSLTRPKSNASIVVDMGNSSSSSSSSNSNNRGSDGADLLRLKSNGALDHAYNSKKTNALRQPEFVSTRIHCIPLLMVLVYFILWTASSEIMPEVKGDATSELFVMRMDSSNQIEEQQRDEVGTRTVMDYSKQLGAYVKGDGAHSLEYYRSRKRLPVRATYMRGTAS